MKLINPQHCIGGFDYSFCNLKRIAWRNTCYDDPRQDRSILKGFPYSHASVNRSYALSLILGRLTLISLLMTVVAKHESAH